jgi:hypothetical protein
MQYNCSIFSKRRGKRGVVDGLPVHNTPHPQFIEEIPTASETKK